MQRGITYIVVFCHTFVMLAGQHVALLGYHPSISRTGHALVHTTVNEVRPKSRDTRYSCHEKARALPVSWIQRTSHPREQENYSTRAHQDQITLALISTPTLPVSPFPAGVNTPNQFSLEITSFDV